MKAGQRLRFGVFAIVFTLLAGIAVASVWASASTSEPPALRPAVRNPSAPAAPSAMTKTDVRPSAGCGTAATVEPGTSKDFTLDSGGLERSYRLHLPSSYDPHHALPLVVAFHGRSRSASLLEARSGLSNLPAIVAYPNGVANSLGKSSWQGAPYAAKGVDDVAYTAALLDTLEDALCVNLERVYAVGHSNGGGFSILAGCQLRDRFAAAVAVSGAFYGKSAGCPDPLSIMEVHGTDDRIVDYDGADLSVTTLPSVAQWVLNQAAINGCERTPSKTFLGLFVMEFAFHHCSSGHPVEHLRRGGGGHAWPLNDVGDARLYVQIWRFLRTQTLQH